MFFVNVSVTVFLKDCEWQGRLHRIVTGENPLDAAELLMALVATLVNEAEGVLQGGKDEMDVIAEVSPCTKAESVQLVKQFGLPLTTALKGAWERLDKMTSLPVGGGS